MNAPAHPAAFGPAADPVSLIAAAMIPAQRNRADGWTPDRRRAFLEAVADGHTADAAARSVGLSATSAYALRRRPAGAAFALGWDAARLLARETVADRLGARAIDGQEKRIVRPDGSEVVRFRYDNRLAQYLLTRLDRYADGAAPTDAGRAARLAAQDFDQFLNLVAADAGPARAALFLRARDPDGCQGEGAAPPAARLPLAALARADLCARAGAGLPHEVDVSDLDLDARGLWTADQWCRAEAAGLLTLGAPPPAAGSGDPHEPQLPQLKQEQGPHDPPVWWDEGREEWRTRFPPRPAGWLDEEGEWGEDTYERALTHEEEQVVAAASADADAADLAEAEAERDAWFAAVADENNARAAGQGDATGGDAAGDGARGGDATASDAAGNDAAQPGGRPDDEARPTSAPPGDCAPPAAAPRDPLPAITPGTPPAMSHPVGIASSAKPGRNEPALSGAAARAAPPPAVP